MYGISAKAHGGTLGVGQCTINDCSIFVLLLCIIYSLQSDFCDLFAGLLRYDIWHW